MFQKGRAQRGVVSVQPLLGRSARPSRPLDASAGTYLDTALPPRSHRSALQRFLGALAGVLLLLSAPATSRATALIIGLIPEQNVFEQMRRYEPLGRYLEQNTGLEIRFTILSRYGNIINSFTSENMDGAFWGSFTGALAIKKLGVQPIARPIWSDGTSTYHGQVFVRKDSGIDDVAKMKGKVLVFVDRATTAGYVFPMAYFKRHGVKDIDTYFKEHYFAGSHDAAILAVLDGKADVGCAKNTIFSLVAERDQRVAEELVTLVESPKVPSNGLAMRKDLDPVVREKLLEALLGMTENSEGRGVLRKFGAVRFIPTTQADYDPVFEVARMAGIDLAGYHYVNE